MCPALKWKAKKFACSVAVNPARVPLLISPSPPFQYPILLFVPFTKPRVRQATALPSWMIKGQRGRWGAEELCNPRGRPRLAGVVLAPVLVFARPRGVWPWQTRKQRIPMSLAALHTHLGASKCSLQPHRTSSSPCLTVPGCVTMLCIPAGPSPGAAASPGGVSPRPPPQDRACSAGSGPRGDQRARGEGSRTAQPFPPD